MTMRYSLVNLIDENCDLYSSSEDITYILENLYNERPSFPFRFTGKGTAPLPEWVCVDLIMPQRVTLCAVFNHNLTTSPAVFNIKGCDDDCPGESGACDWDFAPCAGDMSGRVRRGHRNSYSFMDCTHRYFMLEAADPSIADDFAELGEWWLGSWSKFSTADCAVYPQQGRPDGPQFFKATQVTHFGQRWPQYLSQNDRFILTFQNVNDPGAIDELQVFLQTIHRDHAGRFVFIPDHRQPFIYYVEAVNLDDMANRLVFGTEKELRSWRLELVSLTEGIFLIGS